MVSIYGVQYHVTGGAVRSNTLHYRLTVVQYPVIGNDVGLSPCSRTFKLTLVWGALLCSHTDVKGKVKVNSIHELDCFRPAVYM